MQSLCVLHVTPYFSDAWAYGGIPRLAGAMVRNLATRGHRITVCTTDVRDRDSRLSGSRAPAASRAPRAAWQPMTTPEGATVRVFPNVSNRLAYHLQAFAPLGLRAYLARHAGTFDVAHIHACRNLPGAWAAEALDAAGVPYVLAPNGTAPNLERRRWAKRAFDVVHGDRVTRRASRVLAVTDVERRQLMDAGVDPDRVRVVPNPLDLSEFDALPPPGTFRSRAGLSGPIVAYLGKITPRKRVDLLVHAFAALDRPDASLVVAGNDMGAGRTVRAAVSAAGVEGRTHFPGLLTGADRLALLLDADVVVYPSEHEIFGLVPLEALLCGTPVVVADDSGCGEVVRRVGGGAVVPGTVPTVAAAMADVLQHPAAWRAVVRAAATRVRAEFNADAVGARLEAVYREVVPAR